MLGLYPTWFEPGIGSGWVIGFIATIHILFSHASVGSAIVFCWLARRSVTHNRPEYITFIRRYGLFLLIFSYVLGSVTGPGIWFSATIANPRGLSALIHNFVWLWATEWVFFVIEVIAVYLLVYLAGRVPSRTYVTITTIFGLASVGTLMIIVGILSFMLMPGTPTWFESGTVLSAFFGANTFAQMFARLFFMLMIAGVVGGIIAASIKDRQEKATIVRTLSTIGIFGAILGSLCFVWYLNTLPESAQAIISTRLPESFSMMMFATTGIAILYFIWMWTTPNMLTTIGASVATVVILITGLAPEEYARELIRKPWTTGQYVYSNQIIGRDVPTLGIKQEMEILKTKGILGGAPFIPEHLRNPSEANLVEAGRAVTLAMCVSCHSISNTGNRPLKDLFPIDADQQFVYDYLGAALYRGHISYMPPAPLPEIDRRAMSEYIATMLRSSDPASLGVKGANNMTSKE